MIVNSCQCIGQHQLHIFTMRAQKANLLLCNVVGTMCVTYVECISVSQYLVPLAEYSLNFQE